MTEHINRADTGDDCGSWDDEYDVVVLGSGAAGLAAGLVAVGDRMRTLVVERSEYIGGTTAYSAGTSWIPGHSMLASQSEDKCDARMYLDALIGDDAVPELREVFLDKGPEAIDHLSRLGMRFNPSMKVVDYHSDLPGASRGGRALEPVPFNARRLGRTGLRRIRPPVPEFALFGGTLMIRRAEVDQLLGLYRGSPRAVALAARLGSRWAADLISGYPRGTRLTMGNGLVARLYHQYLTRGGVLDVNQRTTRLIRHGGTVAGITVEDPARGERRIRARRGVILAGGGFPSDDEMRGKYLPTPTPRYTRAVDEADGSTIDLAMGVGAALSESNGENALWFPSSIGRRRDGSRVVFPHIWDRAKPGIVAVAADGRRFVDESVSYHRFTRAMYQAHTPEAHAIPAWLVIDSRMLHKYGLGMIRPRTPAFRLRHHVRNGYLHTGSTIAELAQKMGVDPPGLEKTVAANNRSAATGVDDEFDKGTTTFGRQYGDPHHAPNPNLGPIETAPFYAVPVVPTPLATSLGLSIDHHSRVLDDSRTPIPGLYACGNDAASIMGSQYPGAGCQVGTGMTFAYLAARHAARPSTAA